MAMSAEQQDQAKRYGKVVAKAWGDDGFKQKLLSNPRVVLEEAGVILPSGVEIRVVENTDRVLHVTLPAKPGEELSLEQLDKAAGGFWDASQACSP